MIAERPRHSGLTDSALAVAIVLRRHLEQLGGQAGIQKGTTATAATTEAPSEESGDKTLAQELDAALPGEAINNPASCLEGPDFDIDRCRDLDRQYRAIYCSDISPGTGYDCGQWTAEFGQCMSSWLYRESFCLESCDRCGSKCVDEAPPGYDTCSPQLCESGLYIGAEDGAAQGGPWCLKTCRRCSPSPRHDLVELLP